MGERRQFRTLAQGFAVAGGLGTAFAAAVAAGVFGGMWLDRALGWRPLFLTLLFGVLGGAVGLRMVVRTLAQLDRRSRDDEPDEKAR